MRYHPYNSPSSSQNEGSNGLLGEILKGQKELKEMVKDLTLRVDKLEERQESSKTTQKVPAELSVS